MTVRSSSTTTTTTAGAKTYRKTLVLDFDGVLHAYTSGWQGATTISDPPTPGAIQFLAAATHEFDVCIYSSRSHEPGGIEAMRDWLECAVCDTVHNPYEVERVLGAIKFPTHKPAAFVTLDDRALTFTGEWPSLDSLHAFKPWNKH